MVAPQSMSSLSLIPEEKIKMFPNSSKSTESLYSSSSSKYSSSGLFKRKAAAARQAGLIPATNEVRQRVLSARRLRMKTLQNQLVDAQHHIAELANENRILRTLHKRQDSALSKYENTNAELPQLLHSHAEEVRIWQTKYRNLMSQNKELANKLKQKDSVILNLTDQNKHLTQLNKDKNLEERERLSERVHYLEDRLVEKDNDLKLLARRLQLETKNFKKQLQHEHCRYRDVLQKLERLKAELGSNGRVDLESLEKLPKSSLALRSVTGSGKARKSKSENAQPLFLPQSEVAHLPVNKSVIVKSERDRSQSPRFTKENERASAPATRRTSFLNNRLHRRRSSQKDDLAEAIMKGMSALQPDESLSDDEYEEEIRTKKRVEEKYQVKKDDVYDDDLTDDDNEGDDEDTADVIVTTEIRREDGIDEIRRQMSDDYKEQESLLDTFCKDSSVDNAQLERCKSPQDAKRPNIDPKKKVKLLAALKAIDEDKGEADK